MSSFIQATLRASMPNVTAQVSIIRTYRSRTGERTVWRVFLTTTELEYDNAPRICVHDVTLQIASACKRRCVVRANSVHGMEWTGRVSSSSSMYDDVRDAVGRALCECAGPEWGARHIQIGTAVS